MSSDLGRGRQLDDAPGVVGIATHELPPLPDDLASNPRSGWMDPRHWFRERGRAFEIEIGCGKGTFALNHATNAPEANLLGIEWAREYQLYTADRVRRAGLANVRVLHADASEFLRWRCASGLVSVIHLYFSDPWPKTKHHKNRVVQDMFLAHAWRVLVPGGELRIVTDHDALWAWDMEHATRWTQGGDELSIDEQTRHLCGLAAGCVPFEMRAFMPPSWVGEGQAVGTNYERKKCEEAGKTPHACVLRALKA